MVPCFTRKALRPRPANPTAIALCLSLGDSLRNRYRNWWPFLLICTSSARRETAAGGRCYRRRLFRHRCYPLLCRGHDARISMPSSCFSRGFHEPTPRFPPRAPVEDRWPASAVLSRPYDFLPPVPPHFVAFVGRYLRVHSFGSLPGGRMRRRSLELVTR